jgi:hypothetical protein
MSLAGCAGATTSDSSAESPSARASPTASASAAPAPISTAVPVASAQHQVEAAVLELDELGESGWKREGDGEPDGAPGQRTDSPRCRYQLQALRSAEASARAQRGFAFNAKDPADLIDNVALAYPDTSLASAAFTGAHQRATSCRSWNAGGVGGSDYAFHHVQRTFPVTGLGKAAVGVEIATSAPSVPDVGPTRAYRVVAWSGNLVVVVQFTSTRSAEAVGQRRAIALAKRSIAGR